MVRVLIQAGHHPNGGGAPGEAAWTRRLADELAAVLRAAGVEPVVVGDWFNQRPPAEVGDRDYDLAVFCHYDAAIYGPGNNSGAFADRWRPERGALQADGLTPVPERGGGVTDQTYPVHARALGLDLSEAAASARRTNPLAGREDRFIAIWGRWYGERCPTIPRRNQRRNPNTFDYYGYRATTAATPGVLIEHGVGAPVGAGGFPPGDDTVFLHEHLGAVAQADARAITEFLDLPPGETLAQLAGRTGNPNLVAQVREWQRQRRAGGQDPHDWAACRVHIRAIAADPGAAEPADFGSSGETLAQLAGRTGNPNLVAQVREWQRQRRAGGQDPHDWAACRVHIRAIAADPGAAEPADFAL